MGNKVKKINGKELWVETDPTLTGDGAPADAAAVGAALDKKMDSGERAYALELSEELLSDSPAWSGDGWTQNADGSYTHTVGQTAPLTLALNTQTGEDFYLISFAVVSETDTDAPDASVAVYPSVGGSDAFAIYDGNTGTRTYEKIVRSVADGNLVFQPCDPMMPTDTTNGSFDGTVSNISLRRVLSVREANIVLYDENGNATIEMRQTPTARYNFYMGLGSGKHDVTGKGNVAIGKDSLSDNTSGFWNVALGQNALKANTVGSRNIAIGRVALAENTSGDRNIAIGTFALCRSHGFRNIAIGADAAWYIADGNDNIAIGTQAMESCTTGDNNTVIGSNAVYDADYLDMSVVIGSTAGEKIVGGESVVAIGYNAFGRTERASRSIAIGDHAGNHTGSFNDVICIGNYSTAYKSGQTFIGGARTVETVVKGDFFVLGTDGVKRQIVFNEDGTCSWTAVE